MRQELVETFIEKMYPDSEFNIVSYEKMPRFDFNESGQFVEVDSAIFIDMKISNLPVEKYELSVMLEKFTGYEFSITII
jgi:hypothetical protein